MATGKTWEIFSHGESLMDDGESLQAPPPALLEHWQKFHRVKDERGRVRLQWPEVIIRAEVVAA